MLHADGLVGLVVCAFAVTLALQGCGGGGDSPSPSPGPAATTTTTGPAPQPGFLKLAGFYTLAGNFSAGSFAFTRMVTDRTKDLPNSALTIIGCDDGINFWTLKGTVVNPNTGELSVDFSPIGGPAKLTGRFAENAITWDDGSSPQWVQQSSRAFTLKPATTGAKDVGGFYTMQSASHNSDSTFAGAVMISDILGQKAGDAITAVGSQNGSSYFSLTGSFTDHSAGTLVMESLGKTPSNTGTFKGDTITWQDKTQWVRQAMQKTLMSVVA